MNPLNRFYYHLFQNTHTHTHESFKQVLVSPISNTHYSHLSQNRHTHPHSSHESAHAHTHTHPFSIWEHPQRLPISFKPFSPSPLENQDLPLIQTNSFAQLIPPPPQPRDSLEVSISKSLPPGRSPWPPTLLPDQLRACSLLPFSTTISHIQEWAHEDMWLFKKISLANQIPLSKPGN